MQTIFAPDTVSREYVIVRTRVIIEQYKLHCTQSENSHQYIEVRNIFDMCSTYKQLVVQNFSASHVTRANHWILMPPLHPLASHKPLKYRE